MAYEARLRASGGSRYIGPMATTHSGNHAGRNHQENIMAASRKSTTTTPVPAPASRSTTAEKVVSLRNEKLMSWAQIGAELGFAPRTARRLYQESSGAHTHHGLLPGKGGRLPKGFVTTEASALVAPGTGVWVPRTEAPVGIAGTKGSAVVAPVAPVAPAKPVRKPKVAK